jgi:hypothetical protein
MLLEVQRPFCWAILIFVRPKSVIQPSDLLFDVCFIDQLLAMLRC